MSIISVDGTSNIRLRLLSAAPHVKRVCRAWHEASRVPVPTPGGRRAEGEPKGQGVVARRGLRRANQRGVG